MSTDDENSSASKPGSEASPHEPSKVNPPKDIESQPETTSRYQPGQCGNRNGRPKKQKLSPDDEGFLSEIITVTSNGRRRRITRKQAMQERSFVLAMQGSIPAQRLLLRVGKLDIKAIEKAAVDRYKERAAIEGNKAAQEVVEKIEQMAKRIRENRQNGFDI